MKKLFIIGAGGQGKVCADIALQNGYIEVCFLDDAIKGEVAGFNIVGKVEDAKKFLQEGDFFVAIGNCLVRRNISNVLKEMGAKIVSLVHPKAVIGRQVEIGQGTVVMANAVINASATIGDGAIINTNSCVEHDCKIGDFSHVSIGANIAGTVVVGENCFIGAGATIINNVTICSDCVIGAGAVVVKNIESCGTYVGVPCKKTKS